MVKRGEKGGASGMRRGNGRTPYLRSRIVIFIIGFARALDFVTRYPRLSLNSMYYFPHDNDDTLVRL